MGFLEIFNEHFARITSGKEALLKSVMKDFLEKEPNEEDAKKFGFIHKSGEYNKQSITFCGVIIGEIEYKHLPGADCHVWNFTPSFPFNINKNFVGIKLSQRSPEYKEVWRVDFKTKDDAETPD